MDLSKMKTSELVRTVAIDRGTAFDVYANELDRRFPVQPAPVSGWQPIHTAPNDEQVIVYDVNVGVIASFRTHDGWLARHGRINPSYWIPIPPLPEVPR